jgi:hypothetical protein
MVFAAGAATSGGQQDHGRGGDHPQAAAHHGAHTGSVAACHSLGNGGNLLVP